MTCVLTVHTVCWCAALRCVLLRALCVFVCCVISTGISWLPGLPQQVLQALSEVLDTACFNRLLAACLTQPGV